MIDTSLGVLIFCYLFIGVYCPSIVVVIVCVFRDVCSNRQNFIAAKTAEKEWVSVIGVWTNQPLCNDWVEHNSWQIMFTMNTRVAFYYFFCRLKMRFISIKTFRMHSRCFKDKKSWHFRTFEYRLENIVVSTAPSFLTHDLNI